MKFLVYPFLLLNLELCFCIVSEYCSSADEFKGDVHRLGQNTLILLESADPKTRTSSEKFHKKFKEDTRNSDLKIGIVKEMCPGGVNGTLEAVKMFPKAHVVNLHVNDFYKFNYNYLKDNNLNYAGDIGDEAYDINATVINIHEENKLIKTYEERTQKFHHVKLISGTVKRNKNLRDYIVKFPNGELSRDIDDHLNTVLICTEDFITHYVQEYINDYETTPMLNFKFSSKTDCNKTMEERKHELLAVLAPKAFETDFEMAIPVVFYQTPYHYSGPFKNALTLLKSWRPLIYAFLSFLNKMKWQRVAIISDYSAYSEDFQQELTSLFRDKGVVYTVEHCKKGPVGDCDFQDALSTLSKGDARIIIANVDEENVNTLSMQVVDARMKTNKRIVWLMKHEAFIADVAAKMGDIISISLSLPSATFQHETPQINQIRSGIVRISQAFKEHKTMSPEYYSLFTSCMQRHQRDDRNDEVKAYVTKITSDKIQSVIGSMDIKNNKVQYEMYDKQHLKYTPDMRSCPVRSNHYFKPCNENELMFLMMVLVAFVATILALIAYYTENKARGNRYRNLS